jgi:hypothetical protein
MSCQILGLRGLALYEATARHCMLLVNLCADEMQCGGAGHSACIDVLKGRKGGGDVGREGLLRPPRKSREVSPAIQPVQRDRSGTHP